MKEVRARLLALRPAYGGSTKRVKHEYEGLDPKSKAGHKDGFGKIEDGGGKIARRRKFGIKKFSSALSGHAMGGRFRGAVYSLRDAVRGRGSRSSLVISEK